MVDPGRAELVVSKYEFNQDSARILIIVLIDNALGPARISMIQKCNRSR